ncbi:Histidine phosphatase family protein [Candidatus Nitrotoga sp. HW29]|uniref:phosphohistidine phosphatase SixA n=1 Tax=Candidatus Nitrotoga sp. HW29 TaxID=2886963 RepID=UPI001EF228C1|nr:phosphohistidine phosphatase SixA [Candidatus Nitrotoga sp. HW29]CAH1903945.1 Histidine phosphatase family protein [Candidatus Nitrotoga sp. HW29]
MDLILWRHADAEDGIPDDARKLTAKGEKQARQIGQWLKSHLPKGTRILVSPAKRAHQTASALGLEFEITRQVGTGASVKSVMEAAGWPNAQGAVIVVGHQPTLGRIAATLLSGIEAEWSIKKSEVWWFSNRLHNDETQTILRAVMSQEFL